jgi:uncharacterized low-complexity protein
MKKIISTLTALTFALGLSVAAQAQAVKTPEVPAAKDTKVTQAQVAPKTAEPAGKEVGKAGETAKEAVKPGEQEKVKTMTKKDLKSEAKKELKKVKSEQKPGAPVATPQGATK